MTDSVRVFNLRTGNELLFVGPTPEQAVRAAYLQSIGNNNTWDYDSPANKKAAPAVNGRVSVSCGDFAALR